MAGVKSINIAGYPTCGFYRKAKAALTGLTTIFPDKYDVEVKEFASKEEYSQWLSNGPVPNAGSHRTSPIVWFDEDKFIGGCTEALSWCRNNLTTTEESSIEAGMISDGVAEHSFDYDLVVIGGGSGGLACSKEAKKFGAKVAVLDYVKPSPQGSKWGLGGTCVNVGCIPKKLMHNSALLGEHIKDAPGFGWDIPAGVKHDWKAMRENVQNHIKSLNFAYRVQLREKGVTYLNKLGKFVDPNHLECTDAKGKTQTISAARFVIAVGGRPTPLSCPGGEHSISSDDLFMLDSSPGKTLIVGAGYVALECGGLLSGIGCDTTILVRSIPLRGFDRECVEKIVDTMEKTGTTLKMGASPTNIVKLPSGKLQVTYTSEGGESTTAEFDTVLAAIGRMPDLTGLNVNALGPLGVNARSGKLICAHEQTTVPHIYAIGDVIDDAPELTPVAIMAGKLLAQRLYGGHAHQGSLMNYKNVATTVFTPLEFGTVGLNEEEASALYGADRVDSYLSSFSPLEWTISDHKEHLAAFCKVIVLRDDKQTVIGMHIAAPNAGEIIQGFAVAFKKGLVFSDLENTVGIHPTVAEEFCTLSVTKSSGVSTEKAGC